MVEFNLDNAEDKDLKIPALNPLVKLFKSTANLDGEPRWSLYQPAANQYFHVNWSEFECLARFHKHEKASDLIDDVNNETTLEIDLDDVKALIIFLERNGLLALDYQNPEMVSGMPWWKKLVHNYLFFTVPLFKPSRFLEATLPFVRPFLGKTFISMMMVLLVVGIFLTIQRFDEFTHTFLDMFSLRGAIVTFFVFTAIKIVHELAHAYVATKHGVKVPHMGFALIIMYPVLYTETTASWRLDDRKKRIEIGLAGVMAELVLAAIFLMLWHILPPGIERSIAFSVVAISLLGSLFVNLNPLMRFDGYFVLSDALNVENLHARAIAFSRWRLREFLFKLGDEKPEQLSVSLNNFMINFGFAVLIYRFFLFLGIAVLVYAVFLKPLGLFMMMLELLWFIGIPIWKELKIWWGRMGDIILKPRAWITLGFVGIVLVFSFVPFHSTIAVDGVLKATQQRAIFAPSPAYIAALNVTEGQSVKEGDVLAVLKSDRLEDQWNAQNIHLQNLQKQQRRDRMDIESYRLSGNILEDKISEAKQKLNTLKKQKDRLIVKATFDGTIRDLSQNIHESRYISNDDLLFRIVNDDRKEFLAYINEDQLPRLAIGNRATFHPDFSLISYQDLEVSFIDQSNAETLSRAELSSMHGGNIPSTIENNQIVPLEPIYAIRLNALKKNDIFKNSSVTYRGQIRIQAKRQSSFIALLQRTFALIIRESGFN